MKKTSNNLTSGQYFTKSERNQANEIRSIILDYIDNDYSDKIPKKIPVKVLLLLLDFEFDVANFVFEEYWVDVSDEDLLELSRSEFYKARHAAAWNPKTPGYILATLSKDTDYRIRAMVAQHNKTPEEIRVRLSDDECYKVREHIAINNHSSYSSYITPPELLYKLSQDKSAKVRRAVAYNDNTPAEILVELVMDDDVCVRRAVADNCISPPEALDLMSKDDDLEVRKLVASNSNSSTFALNIMGTSSKEIQEVKDKVVMNLCWQLDRLTATISGYEREIDELRKIKTDSPIDRAQAQERTVQATGNQWWGGKETISACLTVDRGAMTA